MRPSCFAVACEHVVADANILIQVQNPRYGVMGKTFPSADDLNALSSKCEKLSSFKVNILRATSFGGVDWEKTEGKWTGGVIEGKGVAAAAASNSK